MFDMMRKYDTNRSGKLEEGQLALMLKDLNGGHEVTKVGTTCRMGTLLFLPLF